MENQECRRQRRLHAVHYAPQHVIAPLPSRQRGIRGVPSFLSRLGRESRFWSCPPFPSERTADYDINSFARAVLKHKGAFSGGIRRATVIIPRLLPPAVPTNRATDSSDINNFNSRLRAKECDRRHTLIPDRPGLLPHVGRARFVSRGENCSLLRSLGLRSTNVPLIPHRVIAVDYRSVQNNATAARGSSQPPVAYPWPPHISGLDIQLSHHYSL